MILLPKTKLTVSESLQALKNCLEWVLSQLSCFEAGVIWSSCSLLFLHTVSQSRHCWHSGPDNSLLQRGHPMHYRTLSSNSSFCLLEANGNPLPKYSRYCQMSSEGGGCKNHIWLRTTVLVYFRHLRRGHLLFTTWGCSRFWRNE